MCVGRRLVPRARERRQRTAQRGRRRRCAHVDHLEVHDASRRVPRALLHIRVLSRCVTHRRAIVPYAQVPTAAGGVQHLAQSPIDGALLLCTSANDLYCAPVAPEPQTARACMPLPLIHVSSALPSM